MEKYSKFDRVMETRDHFKNGASSKNQISRGNFVVAFIALFVSISACNKDEVMNNKDIDQVGNFILERMSGTYLNNMALDNNHVLYFVTSEIDEEVERPIWSSSIPFRYYLSRKISETGDFEIMNDRFVNGKLCFDKRNNLWCYDYKAVYKVEGNSYNKILELPSDKGLFQFLAFDNDNNIWVGGLQTGLYKIDSHLNIIHYDENNSMLPSTIMDAIHIDKNNTVWIGFWGGVLKISNDQWVVYDGIASHRTWCMVTDKNGHLWAGTGSFNEANQSLIRFDGTQWETINPRNDKNEFVKGTVRYLQSDGHKIYVVSEHVDVYPNGNGAMFASNELLTFDGVKWDKVCEIPEGDGIADLVVDNYRKFVYVRTLNKGIFKIPINID